MQKVTTKLCLLLKISRVEVAPRLLPKIFGVEVTPSVTSVESSERFWPKVRQIWRICVPCTVVATCQYHKGGVAALWWFNCKLFNIIDQLVVVP